MSAAADDTRPRNRDAAIRPLASNIVKLGGWLGLATAAAAWYASFAAVTNATFGRVVLPVRPLQR